MHCRAKVTLALSASLFLWQVARLFSRRTRVPFCCPFTSCLRQSCAFERELQDGTHSPHPALTLVNLSTVAGCMYTTASLSLSLSLLYTTGWQRGPPASTPWFPGTGHSTKKRILKGPKDLPSLHKGLFFAIYKTFLCHLLT